MNRAATIEHLSNAEGRIGLFLMKATDSPSKALAIPRPWVSGTVTTPHIPLRPNVVFGFDLDYELHDLDQGL